MVVAAAVGAVGSIAGGVIASSGAKSAAKASAQAADRASEVQQQIYGENKQTLAPYVQTGLPAMQNVNSLLGLGGDQAAAERAFDAYRKSTGYDFRLNQGLNAVQSGFAGRGTLQSGAAMKALNDYGQGMASGEFGNYLNALGTQQGLGFSAAGAQAGVATNYANSLGNIYQANGANQANAALASANALGSGISGAANAFGTAYGYGTILGKK